MITSPPAFSIFSLAPTLNADAEIFIFFSINPLPKILTGFRDERMRPESFKEDGLFSNPF